MTESRSTSSGELDYGLPPELVAARPAERRDGSRLLVLERGRDELRHTTFAEIPAWLRAGDLLVLNDTRVIPARLRGRRPGGGGVELLLLRREGKSEGAETWSALARPGRRLRRGGTAAFPGGIEAVWLDDGEEGGERRVRLRSPRPVAELLEEVGEIPLPPYIDRPADESDRDRYQTVYARRSGSVAAPTAGLHFTEELLDRVRASGIEIAFLTLHVGPGTFLPVRDGALGTHRMAVESVVVPRGVAEAVNRARREGRRIVAVGTTTVRALEGAPGDGDLEPFEGAVSLFIRPGYRFRRVDGLVTNFHLPRSTLLALVAAFAGRERILAAYREAVARRYRFYSYGDAMLLL